MDCGKSNLINQGFKIFREIYTDFLRELFHKEYGPHWFQKIQPMLKTSREKKIHGNTYFDIPNIMSLILGNWDSFLEKYITKQERAYLFEVRNMRNRWAHQENISSNDLFRVLDNIHRLLNLHYFNNQEIETSTSIQEFDASKISHINKLKDYVLLKIAENIEKKYGIEKRRVRPEPRVKLQRIIFGANKGQQRNRGQKKIPPPRNSFNHGPPRNVNNNNNNNNNNNRGPPAPNHPYGQGNFRGGFGPPPPGPPPPNRNNFQNFNNNSGYNNNNFNMNINRNNNNNNNNNFRGGFQGQGQLRQGQTGGFFQGQEEEEYDISMMDRKGGY